MSGFGKGVVKGVQGPGRTAGGAFGKAFLTGFTAIAGAASLVGTALYKVGSTFDAMTDSIQVGTGATGAALDGLVESAKNVGRRVPVEFDQIGDSLATLNTLTGATGTVLEDMMASVLEGSRLLGEDGVANSEAFGKMMQQWQIPAEEGSAKMDALYVATQKYGMGLNETMGYLNVYGSVLQNADFSMEESAALFGQLQAAGLSVSRIMPGLNSAFRRWAGEGKNSQEELNKTVEAMKNATTNSEALAIATEAFGAEGAQRLTTAVRSGALSLDDLTGALADSEGAIAQSSEETQSFAEKWQMFKNDILARIEPAATALFDAVAAGMGWIMDKGVPAVESFVSEWRDRLEPTFKRVGNFITGTLIPGFRDFTGWLKDNAEWLKPIAVGIGTMIALWKSYQFTLVAVGAVQKAWTAITTAMTAAQKLLNGALRANPIGLVITAIAGLVAGLTYAYKNSETFRNIVNGAWAAVKKAVSVVWNFLRDKVFKPIANWFGQLGDNSRAMKKTIVGAWDSMKAGLKAAWDFIKRLVLQAFQTYINIWKTVITTAVRGVVSVWNGIKSAFRAVYDWVKRRVIDAFATAVNNWKGNIQRTVSTVKSVWGGLKNAFRSVYNWVKTNVIDRFKNTLDGLVTKVRTIRDRIGDAWRGIANKFRNPINWVINRVWNNGLAGAFNRAASAIGISTRLPDAVAIPAFAKGGRHKGGWALVGEEGPELVNFSNPGRVYTADQTREALAGRGDAAGVPAMGDLWGTVSNWVSGAVDWVRGGLARAASAVLNPLKTLIGQTVGQWGSFGRMGGDVAKSAIDGVIKWIRGKDDDYGDDGTAPPLRGGWRRPSRGPVTSEFGSRWGGFHAGIDVAGGGPTYASRAGQVVKTGWNIGPGRTGIGILLSHGGGTYTYYGHNPPGGVKVAAGDMVRSGQRIGTQGATGNVTGTHVHFELHRGGAWRAVNPRQLGVFDEGGMLAPGAAAINLGSKPEPVLTPGQWDIMKSAVTTSPGLSADEQYQALYAGARDGVSSGFTGATRSARATARMGGY